MNRNIYLRIAFIPLSGIAIPAYSGLIAAADHSIPASVGASLYFIIIACIVWEGCRRIHDRLRTTYAVHANPLLRIVSLCGTAMLYCTGVAGILVMIFLYFLGETISWNSIAPYIGLQAVAALIFTLVYEIILLSNEKEVFPILEYPPQSAVPRHHEELVVPFSEVSNHVRMADQVVDKLPVNNVRKKNRLVVKKGLENIAIRIDDIVLFYTENKLVYLLDQQGKKFLAEKNLSDLEEELNQEVFFRANRQYIININYVRGFKTYDKVKLQVGLTVPELDHSIIISQETAPAFRKWMNEG